MEKFRSDAHVMNVKQIEEAWDLCNAAKTMPGKIDAPFINGMNLVSNQTGIVST